VLRSTRWFLFVRRCNQSGKESWGNNWRIATHNLSMIDRYIHSRQSSFDFLGVQIWSSPPTRACDMARAARGVSLVQALVVSAPSGTFWWSRAGGPAQPMPPHDTHAKTPKALIFSRFHSPPCTINRPISLLTALAQASTIIRPFSTFATVLLLPK
jgi:hypothetical protein